MREDEDASRGSVERAIKTQHAVRLGDDAEPRQGLAGIGETQLKGEQRGGLGATSLLAGVARRLFVRSAAMGDMGGMACP
jgi:hypothetical protein